MRAALGLAVGVQAVVGREREELVLARVATARAVEDVAVRLDHVDAVLVHVAEP